MIRSPRRGILVGALTLSGAATAATRAPPKLLNPDAELVRLCTRHSNLIDAVNSDDCDCDDDDPRWVAYAASRDAISEARPQTLLGMRAKALVAKVEARNPDGSEEAADSMAAEWAWDLLNDLLRLTGGAA